MITNSELKKLGFRKKDSFALSISGVYRTWTWECRNTNCTNHKGMKIEKRGRALRFVAPNFEKWVELENVKIEKVIEMVNDFKLRSHTFFNQVADENYIISSAIKNTL